jgi:hypothetical protein
LTFASMVKKSSHGLHAVVAIIQIKARTSNGTCYWVRVFLLPCAHTKEQEPVLNNVLKKQ